MALSKIIIFGKIPPPIGGVTISIKNLIFALKAKHVNSKILTFKNYFNCYDIAHIHYSSLWKRVLGVVLARFIAKKVIFTVHGKYLDSHSIFNRISIHLSHGIILLNDNLHQKFCKRPDSDKFTVLPSIFREGLEGINSSDEIFDLPKNKKCILIYAYDRSFHQGEEIYGVEFILNNIHLIDKTYQIVLLDISGKYIDIVKEHTERVTYINKAVNFFSLLRQVEIYVRPTCMDGSSIAIQEALLCNIPVLASNVVDRAPQVVTYQHANITDFLIKLHNIKPIKQKVILKSIQDYLDFCEQL